MANPTLALAQGAERECNVRLYMDTGYIERRNNERHHKPSKDK